MSVHDALDPYTLDYEFQEWRACQELEMSEARIRNQTESVKILKDRAALLFVISLAALLVRFPNGSLAPVGLLAAMSDIACLLLSASALWPRPWNDGGGDFEAMASGDYENSARYRYDITLINNKRIECNKNILDEISDSLKVALICAVTEALLYCVAVLVSLVR